MKITKLMLKNFRNYAFAEFEFDDSLTILTGGNAQGKTNCAEAVYYLCTGYSPRAITDREIIKSGEDKAELSGSAVTAYGQLNIDIEINRESGKEIRVNSVKVAKAGELLGNINAVFFNPSELKIVQESPEDRRRFMDLAISQISRGYYYALLRYRKILFQRNNLLKYPKEQDIIDTLPAWDEHFCKYGAEIIAQRYEFIDKIRPLAREAHSYLTGGAELLEIENDIKYSGDIKSGLLADLKKRYTKDIRFGFTGIGPHRDDLKLSINGTDVKTYGSQGQKRTAALSIKLAEAEFFKGRTGEYPVIILDDVLSELDRPRKKKLFDKIADMQVILTCTEKDRFLYYRPHREISIRQGEIIKGE